MGFFGYTLRKHFVGKEPKWTPVARFRAVVDLDEAHAAVGDILAVWREVADQDAPAFSGGVFDSWPRRIAAGLAFLRAESSVISALLRHQEG